MTGLFVLTNAPKHFFYLTIFQDRERSFFKQVFVPKPALFLCCLVKQTKIYLLKGAAVGVGTKCMFG